MMLGRFFFLKIEDFDVRSYLGLDLGSAFVGFVGLPLDVGGAEAESVYELVENK